MVAPGYVARQHRPARRRRRRLDRAQRRSAARATQRPAGDRRRRLFRRTALPLRTAFDDCGTQTPARLLREAAPARLSRQRRPLCRHEPLFPAAPVQGEGYLVARLGDPLCTPARAWHLRFLRRVHRGSDSAPIASLSYEVLAQHCPDAWQQRAHNGDPARTGWDPPSALLSPANRAAMAWLQLGGGGVRRNDAAAGAPVRFQIGEPWWWIIGRRPTSASTTMPRGRRWRQSGR